MPLTFSEDTYTTLLTQYRPKVTKTQAKSLADYFTVEVGLFI